MNVLIFLLVLVGLIMAHELGHFLAARLLGIRVEEFGVGFPPRLWSRRRGGTIYSVNALPLGGFVKLAGEFGGSAAEPGTFTGASVWRRIVVVSAGVLMNFVLAWVLLLAGYLGPGLPPITRDTTQYAGASVASSAVVVARVMPDTPAVRGGLAAGDELAGWTTTESFQQYTREHAGQEVVLTVERAGETLRLPVTLAAGEAPLGVEIFTDTATRLPLWSAARAAAAEVGGLSGSIFSTLWNLLRAPFSSGVAADLSGPVGIYQATSAATNAGGSTLLVLIVLLSVNLAVINILPIPALDGGRLAFLLVEAVARRRVVREEIEGIISTVGFVLLLGLLILLTVRDIFRL